MSIRHRKLPIAALERIDDQCAAFEKQWQSSDPPTIESFLSGVISEEEQEVLLAELVVLEVDYRRRQGEKPTRREYLDRFPHHTAVISEAFQEEDGRTGGFSPPAVDHLSALFPSLEILELLGAGGMGAVYKARQTGLDRLVALKILPNELSHDAKFALRFTREARTLAKLNHPNIVSVYEFGKSEETYYFLMEYVEGSTLRDIVKAGQLAPEHALAIVPHLCDALQYAHDQGVIHRDIKPENILIAQDGSVKIADFGLSRMLGNENRSIALTGTKQVMGTMGYMAPEQLQGAHTVDQRADIYSLGVVFYEMLTGQLPIGRFAAPSQKVDIDVRLDDVVLRTLETQPQLRYQQARQVKSDVQSITSSHHSQVAETVVASSTPETSQKVGAVSLEQQELAGRMLLTRRQLMQRVENSLQPLYRGQFVQILFGILLILLGVWCWARNTEVLYRVISGAILHVYGVLVISQALLVITRIRRIDYSKPVVEIRNGLNRLRAGYLRAGIIVGFIWWLMWIPVCVAIGFDGVLHPYSLVPSLFVGLVGFAVSVGLFLRVLSRRDSSADAWKTKLAAKSIAAAYLALEEIENAHIV
jgi:serine/threonine protein kinase